MRYMVITVPNSDACANLLDVVKKKNAQDYIGFTSFNSDLGAALLEEYPDAGVGMLIDTTDKKVLTVLETVEVLKGL